MLPAGIVIVILVVCIFLAWVICTPLTVSTYQPLQHEETWDYVVN